MPLAGRRRRRSARAGAVAPRTQPQCAPRAARAVTRPDPLAHRRPMATATTRHAPAARAAHRMLHVAHSSPLRSPSASHASCLLRGLRHHRSSTSHLTSSPIATPHNGIRFSKPASHASSKHTTTRRTSRQLPRAIHANGCNLESAVTTSLSCCAAPDPQPDPRAEDYDFTFFVDAGFTFWRRRGRRSERRRATSARSRAAWGA